MKSLTLNDHCIYLYLIFLTWKKFATVKVIDMFAKTKLLLAGRFFLQWARLYIQDFRKILKSYHKNTPITYLRLYIVELY